jgi:protein-L-isoaspartate(D-aspartate) O-methyltransferase
MRVSILKVLVLLWAAIGLASCVTLDQPTPTPVEDNLTVENLSTMERSFKSEEPQETPEPLEKVEEPESVDSAKPVMTGYPEEETKSIETPPPTPLEAKEKEPGEPEKLNETPPSPAKKPEEPAYLTKARDFMVWNDLQRRGINSPKVLEVMGRLHRQDFVPEDLENQAYSDHPLPIGEGQTISQPYVVALMTQSLNLTGEERVLEIGTGSGYQAAVLAELVDEVYSIEIRENLAKKAKERFEKLGYTNIWVKNADGYFGWEEHAPYDAVMITAAVNHVPPPLLAQLGEGGKLILPLGSTTYFQTLTLVEKKDGELSSQIITSVRFVPLIGEAQK